MKKTFKIIAAVLLVAIISCTVSGIVSASSYTEATCEIRCLKTFNDKEFPFDLFLVVPEEERILDVGETAPSTAAMYITVKESFSDFTYTLNYFTIKEDEDTINQNGVKAQALLSDITIPADNGLSADIAVLEIYSFSIECIFENEKNIYLGSFITCYDWDGSLCVDISYKKYTESLVSTYTLTAPLVVENEENIDNNVQLRATTLSMGAMARGYMTYPTDMYDYYKFTTGNIDGFVNIRVTYPYQYGYTGPDLEMGMVTDYDIAVLNSNGTVIAYSYNRDTADEYICVPVSALSTYYIKMMLYNDGGGNNYPYTVETSFQPVYKWYTQMTGHSDTYGYYTWNTHLLNQLYFPDNDYEPGIPFLGASNIDYRMEEGCAIASFAMVLRNIGVKMYGKDLRTGLVGYMEADPYTVTLANLNLDGTETKVSNSQTTPYLEYNSSTQRWNYYNVTDDPMIYRSARIGTAFELDMEVQPQTLNNATVAQKVSAIENALEYSPCGVIVHVKKGNYEHYLVVVGVNPQYSSSDPIENKFIVCDPATSVDAKGNNVSFDVCYSHTERGVYLSDILDILWYETIA